MRVNSEFWVTAISSKIMATSHLNTGNGSSQDGLEAIQKFSIENTYLSLIVTVRKITRHDFEAYIRRQLANGTFPERTRFHIFSGAHGMRDGRLTVEDKRMYREVCDAVERIKQDPSINTKYTVESCPLHCKLARASAIHQLRMITAKC